jgi:large subunit ribosomal protein L25
MGADPITISVDSSELRAALNTDAGLNAVITLQVEGDSQLSIITDLQRHPVRRDVLHVDFLRVDPDAEVVVDVPLILFGEAKKITQANGMVDQVAHHLTLVARPADIPDEIRVDVSDLDVGSSLRTSDIVLPAGVRPAGDPDAPFAVGVITRSTMEFMRAEEEAEAAEELAEVEAADAAEAEGEGDGDGDRESGSEGSDRS